MNNINHFIIKLMHTT